MDWQPECKPDVRRAGQSHEGKMNRCNRFTPPLQGGTVVHFSFPRAAPWAIFDSSLRDEGPAGIQQADNRLAFSKPARGGHPASGKRNLPQQQNPFMRLPWLAGAEESRRGLYMYPYFPWKCAVFG
jgi:hypothetical protein